MVQTTDVLEQFPEFLITALYNLDEAIAVGVTFANVFLLDIRKTSDGMMVLYNDSTVEAIQYKIFGSIKQNNGVIPPDLDESWINTLIHLDLESIDEKDPATYDHDFFKTLPPKTAKVGRTYESFSNKWAWIRVQAKAPNAVTMRIWERGSNVG